MAGARLTPIDMLKRLVAFDTTSSKSNLALIEDVRAYLEGHGVAARLVPNEDGTKANLFATIGPEGDGGVVLSGHTDVVPVEGQDWTGDPFDPVERDGRLYGRGTTDMKGFIATVLALVPDMVAARPKTPLHFAFSYDEEVGCLGVRPLLALLARELPRPRLAIIGEPTEMKVANAHKGVYSFRTTVTGREAHSSASHLGVSAVGWAARIIDHIYGVAERLTAPEHRHPDFDPPYTTLNVGLIQGGTARNIIARQCRFAWEIRPVPGADPEAIRAEVEIFIDGTVLPAMRARFPGANVVTEVDARVPPLVPEDGSPAEALMLALTGQNRAGTVPFASEAGLFQAEGIPAVLCGPGSVRQAHQPDEFVEIAQIAACESFLRKLIAWAAADR
ncbi:MAG TPA: acetylornithine deacetylase [Alphaproteobacteria bacterium]|jgi:acetylornithine deacetylase